MNEAAAVASVHSVIDSAKNALVVNLVQSGQNRKIEFLSPTRLALPAAYYAIFVDCINAREYVRRGANVSSLANSPKLCVYDMVIAIADYVLPEVNETYRFQTAHTNFRKLCDRIVKLISKDMTWFPNATASPKFRLRQAEASESDVLIKKTNNEPYPLQDAPYYLISSILEFTIIDELGDSTLT